MGEMQRFGSPARGLDVSTSDEAIYIKLKDDLVRYAAALVGSDKADDVLSTVMVRVLRRRSLSSLDDPRAYLFRAVLNEARGVLRHKPGKPLPAMQSSADVTQADWGVVEAVAALPAQQRAVVFLRYWEDLPVDEIAVLVRTRPGTVKRYLHLAHRKLKGALS